MNWFKTTVNLIHQSQKLTFLLLISSIPKALLAQEEVTGRE
jgi:hypothetical protein